MLLGTNVDDLGDHRPGLAAANERGARHPLVEAELTKAEVRALSQALGLSTWDKPQLACLSSRFPYGTEITPERLAQIDRFEEGLYDLGFRQLRVRYHDSVARLELEGDALPLAVDKRAAIVALGKASGLHLRRARSRGLPLGRDERDADAAPAALMHAAGSRPILFSALPKRRRPLSKKETFLRDKDERKDVHLARAPAPTASPVLTLHNVWTNESLPVVLASPKRRPSGAAFDELARDHYTNQATKMDARLFETIVRAAEKFHARYVEIVSGFRAPKYQLMLRKKGHEVARDSQHPRGHAVDFRIADVPTKIAAALRALAAPRRRRLLPRVEVRARRRRAASASGAATTSCRGVASLLAPRPHHSWWRWRWRLRAVVTFRLLTWLRARRRRRAVLRLSQSLWYDRKFAFRVEKLPQFSRLPGYPLFSPRRPEGAAAAYAPMGRGASQRGARLREGALRLLHGARSPPRRSREGPRSRCSSSSFRCWSSSAYGLSESLATFSRR